MKHIGGELTTIWSLEHNEQVHSTDFRKVVLWTMQPQVLSISLLSSGFLRDNSRSVVRTELEPSSTYSLFTLSETCTEGQYQL